MFTSRIVKWDWEVEILIWHIKKKTENCHYSLLNKIKCVCVCFFLINMDFRILIWHTRTWCPFFVCGVCTFLGLSFLITLCTIGGTVYVMFGCKKKNSSSFIFFQNWNDSSFFLDFFSIRSNIYGLWRPN